MVVLLLEVVRFFISINFIIKVFVLQVLILDSVSERAFDLVAVSVVPAAASKADVLAVLVFLMDSVLHLKELLREILCPPLELLFGIVLVFGHHFI